MPPVLAKFSGTELEREKMGDTSVAGVHHKSWQVYELSLKRNYINIGRRRIQRTFGTKVHTVIVILRLWG